jgi:hypothetical protein
MYPGGGEGVVSSVLLSTANSSVQSLSLTPCELVGDLDLEGPSIDGELGLGVLLRLGGLHNLVLFSSLHVDVVLVVPCKLVGGLDLESEGSSVDG